MLNPTSPLTPQLKQEFIEDLKEFKDDNTTIGLI